VNTVYDAVEEFNLPMLCEAYISSREH